MLKIKELRFSGIGRFVEPQVIHFNELGNLVQIDGQNNNTGGSSGAGKSTVFNALDYLFGLNDLPNTVLQSRLTKDGISVAANFDWDGNNLWISRSKSRGLVIEIHDQVISGSNKIAEEKLDEIIAMPRHLFRQMLHKRQKEGGFFLSLTPKEIHEFLTDCLGLSDLRIKLEIIEKKLKELTDKKVSFDTALQSNKSALKATQEAILTLGLAPIKDISEEIVEDLRNKAGLSAMALDALLKTHTMQLVDLERERPQVSIAPFDRSQIEAFEKGINIIITKIRQLEEQEKQRVAAVYKRISDIKVEKSKLESQIRLSNSAKTEAATVALEIKKIRESLCPTCEQSWANDLAKQKEANLLLKLKNLKDSIEVGNKAQEALIVLDQELKTLEPELQPRPIEEINELMVKKAEIDVKLSSERKKEQEHQMNESYSNRVIMDAFAARQKELRDKQAQEASQARGQAEVDRRAFEVAANKLKAYTEAKTRHENSIIQLNTQQSNYEKKVEELTNALSTIELELLFAEEARKVIKSYASCSFDEALALIGDVSTRIIRNIPNMANATIQLEGIKETAAGKIKEEVNAVIHMDGEEAVPIKSLSGGERSSVDLAVDLAVIDLIENKTNKGIDIFILDEPFTGLDTVSIEMALEVLRNANLNKKIIIVDHNPVISQMVVNKILVSREGSTSRIVQCETK